MVVLTNPEKKPTFSIEKRLELINRSVARLKNVKTDCWDKLLADYIDKSGTCAIIKGLRAVSDFEYEFQMALANKALNPKAETIFIASKTKNMYLSSSLVKQIGSFGGKIDSFVPKEILTDVKKVLMGGKK